MNDLPQFYAPNERAEIATRYEMPVLSFEDRRLTVEAEPWPAGSRWNSFDNEDA
jgi:hypothetical protein